MISAELWYPILVVLGALILIGALSPSRSNAARSLFVAIAVAASARYQWWRWTDTLPEHWWRSGEGLYAIFCFVFETLVLLDCFIGMAVLSRSIDRSGEADAHEAAMRGLSVEDLPSVDVLIPTYDEGPDVLERTIVAAMALDYPKFTVHVCDDKRRPWVAELAAAKGAKYLTRADNTHAKAGNINAAVARTDGDLVVVLDADFAARRQFLWRTVGFFRDPTVACVQTPQYFFNKDPVQTNLGLFGRCADDQRLFFDAIMPARDAWGAAFCCGTGFVIRRTALEAIGGIPGGSLCEDMLTSIELTRRGLRTIYLKEELCIGLAPESVAAFFVQRMRWSRGNIQILFLKNGVFGRGLPLFYRLLFLPTYWVLQLPARIAYVLIPLVYLLTGLAPLESPDPAQLFGHLVPAIAGSLGLICWLGRDCYVPILTDAAGLFMAIRVAPATLRSLLKPFGAAFKVTPKGAAASATGDRRIVFTCLGLLAVTIGAIAMNGLPDWRVVDNPAGLAMASFWAIVNAVIIALAALIARERSHRRADERFPIGGTVRCRVDGTWIDGTLADMSLSGARIEFAAPVAVRAGETIELDLLNVGTLSVRVVRAMPESLGLAFAELTDDQRDRLIRMLFTESRPVARTEPPETLALVGTLANRLFGADEAG